MAEYTFSEFQAEYPNDAACLAKLMEITYGGTEITCPACGVAGAKFHPMAKRRAYACQGMRAPCLSGARVPFFTRAAQSSPIWFFAMYFMTSTRHGVAAKEIERQTGVTYKCAWRICHELRKLMAAADASGPIGGAGKHVEIDETLKAERYMAKGPATGRKTKRSLLEC